MEYTTKRLEVSRGRVKEQEKRVARQRAKVEKALADRHPADELQARLLIMEQSLIAMARFLKILERDLGDALGLHKHQTEKRIKAARKAAGAVPAAPAPAEALVEVAAPPATAAQDAVPFDTVVKAMRKLSDR